MTDERLFDERRKVLEEEFFRKQDHELLDRLRREDREAHEREVMGQALGIDDEGLLRDLQAAGFGSDTLVLLYLVPGLKVAWVDGILRTGARKFLEQAAEFRGVQQDTAASRLLERWLAAPPPDEVYDVAFRALQASIGSLRGDAGVTSEQRLIDLCTRVAEATGGVLGFGAISRREREVLQQLAERLTPVPQQVRR